MKPHFGWIRACLFEPHQLLCHWPVWVNGSDCAEPGSPCSLVHNKQQVLSLAKLPSELRKRHTCAAWTRQSHEFSAWRWAGSGCEKSGDRKSHAVYRLWWELRRWFIERTQENVTARGCRHTIDDDAAAAAAVGSRWQPVGFDLTCCTQKGRPAWLWWHLKLSTNYCGKCKNNKQNTYITIFFAPLYSKKSSYACSLKTSIHAQWLQGLCPSMTLIRIETMLAPGREHNVAHLLSGPIQEIVTNKADSHNKGKY